MLIMHAWWRVFSFHFRGKTMFQRIMDSVKKAIFIDTYRKAGYESVDTVCDIMSQADLSVIQPAVEKIRECVNSQEVSDLVGEVLKATFAAVDGKNKPAMQKFQNMMNELFVKMEQS
jgi:hypothetical protein